MCLVKLSVLRVCTESLSLKGLSNEILVAESGINRSATLKGYAEVF